MLKLRFHSCGSVVNRPFRVFRLFRGSIFDSSQLSSRVYVQSWLTPQNVLDGIARLGNSPVSWEPEAQAVRHASNPLSPSRGCGMASERGFLNRDHAEIFVIDCGRSAAMFLEVREHQNLSAFIYSPFDTPKGPDGVIFSESCPLNPPSNVSSPSLTAKTCFTPPRPLLATITPTTIQRRWRRGPAPQTLPTNRDLSNISGHANGRCLFKKETLAGDVRNPVQGQQGHGSKTGLDIPLLPDQRLATASATAREAGFRISASAVSRLRGRLFLARLPLALSDAEGQLAILEA